MVLNGSELLLPHGIPCGESAKIGLVPVSLHQGLAAAATLLLALAAADCSRRHEAAGSQNNDSNRYVNASVCAGCHANVYQSYQRTGMARAFYAPSPESFPDARPYFHRASGTWFQMVSKDGAYY